MREDTRHVPETVERFLDSTLDSVDQAEELTAATAQRAGFDEDELMKIGMAIREAMVNAVVHGNQYNQNKRVRFSLSLTADRFTITVADEGSGFDFAHIPDLWLRKFVANFGARHFSDAVVYGCSGFAAFGIGRHGSNFS